MYKIPRRPGDGPGDTLPADGAPPTESSSPASAEPPEEHVDEFYAMSAHLTGFDEVDLLATGAGNMYLQWLHRVFPDSVHELLAAWSAVARELEPGDRDAALREQILDDAKLGSFARAIVSLWYTATWTPPAWPPVYGPSPENVDRAFGSAYADGLMWQAAIGAHPGGAKPTGFGTWAFPPGPS
jgi:hypothetical protein